MDSRAALSRFALTLAGIDPAKEREEHFFDPIGAEQLSQFFLWCPPLELEELDPEDTRALLLGELNSQTGLEQSAKLFDQPQGFKAHFKGVEAAPLLDQLLAQHPGLVELTLLAGPL